jgi:hypothetical protein
MPSNTGIIYMYIHCCVGRQSVVLLPACHSVCMPAVREGKQLSQYSPAVCVAAVVTVLLTAG